MIGELFAAVAMAMAPSIGEAPTMPADSVVVVEDYRGVRYAMGEYRMVGGGKVTRETAVAHGLTNVVLAECYDRNGDVFEATMGDVDRLVDGPLSCYPHPSEVVLVTPVVVGRWGYEMPDAVRGQRLDIWGMPAYECSLSSGVMSADGTTCLGVDF